MAGFRLSPEAEAELDNIWLRIARESSSIDIASRLVDAIYERFWLLAQFPHMGRKRDDDLAPGLRSFPAEGYVIIHSIEKEEIVAILHVVPGNRDIASLLGFS
jgi:toxin ParE1/3/4